MFCFAPIREIAERSGLNTFEAPLGSVRCFAGPCFIWCLRGWFGEKAGVIVAVACALRHFSAELFESAGVGVEIFEQVAKAETRCPRSARPLSNT